MSKIRCRSNKVSIINFILFGLLLISNFDKTLSDDENEQCEMIHGYNFDSILYKGNEKPEIRCKKLWCVEEDSPEIITNGAPINDGTTCGDEKICIKGMCSDYWGPWMPAGNCSDGIRQMIRHCNFANNTNCQGKNTSFQLCDIQERPYVSYNMLPLTRQQQCNIYNNNKHNWTAPFERFDYNVYRSDPCRLYCIAHKNPEDLVDFGTVIDGTHCLSDSAHHCIKGQCKHMSLVPYNKTENLSSSKLISLSTTNKRELNFTTNESILTKYYSRPYYIRIGVFVDWTMVDYHKENLTTYIEMMMAKVAKVFKHPSIGHSIEIVLTDIIVITIKEWRSLLSESKPRLSPENFSKWVKQKQTYINNFDIPIHITRNPNSSLYRRWSKAPIGNFTHGSLCGPLSPSILVKDNGVYLSHTLTYQIGQALGMPDDSHPLCEIHETKTTMNHAYTVEYPLTWSDCSREFITNCLNSDRAISLREKPNEYIHSSQQLLPGKVYSLDQQCQKTTNEISFYHYESTENLNIGCKSFSCKTLNNSYPIKNIKHPMFDGTPCGPGQMCLDGSCVDKKTYPRPPIHGGWSHWKVGRCSTACGAGIRKYTRHCNDPVPAYGGNYCLGRRIRFEYCNIKECNHKKVDLRKKKCSELNNIFKNFTALYDLNDRAKICKLTCQEIGNSTNVVDYGTVMDGTPCGNDTDSTDDMCIHGECKKIGCNINDDMNEEYGATDICNVTTKYCKVPDPATGQISNDSLCYEMLPESWTVNNIHIVINRIEQRWDKAINYWNNEKFQLIETINRANKNISEFIYNLTKLEMKTYQGFVDDSKTLKNQSINNEDQRRKIDMYEMNAKNFYKYSKTTQEYIYNYTLQQESINKSIEDKIHLRTQKLTYLNRIKYLRYFIDDNSIKNNETVDFILTKESVMIINKTEEFEELVFTLSEDVANEMNLLKFIENKLYVLHYGIQYTFTFYLNNWKVV